MAPDNRTRVIVSFAATQECRHSNSEFLRRFGMDPMTRTRDIEVASEPSTE
jgi:hypothetical protein